MPRLHADHSRLSGPERKQFGEQLLDAFGPDEFDNLLANQLGLRRARISLARNFDAIVFDVIDDAEMKSYTAELLQAARAERQTHVGLFHLAQQLALEPSFAAEERLVRAQLPEIDPEGWLQQGMARLGQVCRVETPVGPGSGFLVGPNLVLTNHHVVAEVLARGLSGQYVWLRFDQRIRSNNQVQSKKIKLPAQDWLVATSPDSAAAYASIPADALDYALLRTSESLGDEVVDSATGQTRGWIPVAALPPPLTVELPLLLLGHPRGDLLKLTLDTQAVISVNATGSRVRYRTNSEPGSSGSPCFDLHWNLAALHHAGDPAEPPQWNEGIPVAALRQHWTALLATTSLADWQRAVLNDLLDQ